MSKEYLEDILNKVFDYGVQSTLDNLLIRGYNTKNMLEQVCLGNSLEKDLNEAKTNITNLKSVKQALQRLEAIGNANPSEALECLKQIGVIEMFYHEGTLLKDSISFKPEYDTIKQALIKAQEQENENKELKEKVKRWHDLLLKSDIDSKGIVVDEIENYWDIKAGV